MTVLMTNLKRWRNKRPVSLPSLPKKKSLVNRSPRYEFQTKALSGTRKTQLHPKVSFKKFLYPKLHRNRKKVKPSLIQPRWAIIPILLMTSSREPKSPRNQIFATSKIKTIRHRKSMLSTDKWVKLKVLRESMEFSKTMRLQPNQKFKRKSPRMSPLKPMKTKKNRARLLPTKNHSR